MTRAAERLNTSQPAVSAHIKTLEDELGVKLFSRTPKGMILTQEGMELKEKAAIVLEVVDDLRASAEKLKGGLHGAVLLGVNTDPHLLRLASIFSELNHCFPGLSLNVLETMSWEAADELLSGNVDLAFTYAKPDDERIQVRHQDSIELAIVGPLGWKECLENVTLNDLTDLPWVWTSEHCPLCRLLKEIFYEAGCEPKKAVVVDQEAAILKLVSEGVGLSIMPLSKAVEVAATHKIFIVTKIEKTLDLFLTYLKRREQDPKVLAILNVIEKVWESNTYTR
jgi:DNA-binding transcriptional LysR family regulator